MVSYICSGRHFERDQEELKCVEVEMHCLASTMHSLEEWLSKTPSWEQCDSEQMVGPVLGLAHALT